MASEVIVGARLKSASQIRADVIFLATDTGKLVEYAIELRNRSYLAGREMPPTENTIAVRKEIVL